MSLLLYDFEKRKEIKLPKKKCHIVDLEIKLTDSDFENFRVLYEKVRNSFQDVVLKENSYFRFNIDAGNNMNDIEDFFCFGLQVGSELCRFMTLPEPRGEKRLNMKSDCLYLTYSNLIGLVNNKSKINCFGFEIIMNNGFKAEMVVEE